MKNHRHDLASKTDLTLEIEKIRVEIAVLKNELIKRQLGIGLAICAIIAKGFNWPGF